MSDIDILMDEIQPSIHRDKLWICIKNLKRNKTFDSRWSCVFSKLFRVGSEENLDYLEEYANILSNREKFFESYFSFFVDYFQCKEHENTIGYLEKEKEKGRTKNKKEIKRIENEIEKLTKEIEKLKVKYCENYKQIHGKEFNEYGEGNFSALCGIRRSKIKYLPCKIIVSEIFKDHDFLKKKVRDFLSPLVALLPKYKDSTKFGMFHTALIIGPWYLEWNCTEIVVPKRSFGSEKAIISYDMPPMLNVTYDDLKTLVHKIVDIIYFWNTHIYYGQMRSDKEYKGNCQDFIDDLFQGINISPEELFKGMFGNFIKSMRKNGQANLEFSPSEEFRECLNLDWKSKLFNTHLELDNFVRDSMQRIPDIKERFMEEFYMLKSFDRAFWLRHFRDNENENWKSAPTDLSKPENMRGCPFNDPRTTMSYIV